MRITYFYCFQEFNIFTSSTNKNSFQKQEEDKDFLYIALELCDATLNDVIKNKLNVNISTSMLEMLHQALVGLRHLHSCPHRLSELFLVITL